MMFIHDVRITHESVKMLAIWENHNTLVWRKIAVVTKFRCSSVTAWVANCKEAFFEIWFMSDWMFFEVMDFHDIDQGCRSRGPHAAREVVLCGPWCKKFVSRLFKFFVFFYRLKYTCHQNTPNLYLLFLLWAYHRNTWITNASKICQLFRFGLHPYKLATLHATMGII